MLVKSLSKYKYARFAKNIAGFNQNVQKPANFYILNVRNFANLKDIKLNETIDEDKKVP